MNILNLLITGNVGGIEILCNNIDKYDKLNKNYWCFLLSGGKIADEMIKRNPNNCFILNYSKYRIISYVKNLSNFCKEKKIDIIVIHHGSMFGNIVYYLLKKFNPNIKYVRYLHSCYSKEDNSIYYYMMKKALQTSDLIIGVSNAVLKSFEKYFPLQNNNTTVIYNGIDSNFYKNIYEKNDYNRSKSFIYVGRLEEEKGLYELINVFSKIIENNKSVKLNIVGTGSIENELKTRVNELNINGNVTFEGVQFNVKKYLDLAEFFIYPSLWYEAFGISVVEAMARGCIPIVSNRGGLTEIVKNKENGFVFEHMIHDNFYDTLIEAINFKDKQRIIQKAYETSKNYSIEKTIGNINNTYIKLFNNKEKRN